MAPHINYYKRKQLQKRLLLLHLLYKHVNKPEAKGPTRKRRYWVNPTLPKRKSCLDSNCNHLKEDMQFLMQQDFFTTFGLTAQVFNKLLTKISPKIKKQTTVLRNPISAIERLCVTLKFLATGDSYLSIASAYKMSRSVVAKIIPETCMAIWDVLRPDVMPMPDSNMWRRTASGFSYFWNFPHCLGSIDGKHIPTHARTGNGFCNDKKSNSIALTTVVDAQYNFLLLDISTCGNQSDSDVFSYSTFGRLLKNGRISLPDDAPFEGTSTPNVPYSFVSDETFPLMNNLICPFSGQNLTLKQKIFNYRLSQVRRVAENAFGVMTSKFKFLQRLLIAKPENAERILKAAVILHNFFNKELGAQYIGPSTVDYEDKEGNLHPGEWRNNLTNGTALRGFQLCEQSNDQAGAQTRRIFANYFCSNVGSVPLQNTIVNAAE